MSSDEPRGLKTETRIGNDERERRNDEESPIRNAQSAVLATQSSSLSPQALAIHIEELVLRGFAPGDRFRIGDAVARGLARFFADQGVSPSLRQNGVISRLDGGEFPLAPDSQAEMIGIGIAQAVYEGLKGRSRR